MGNFSSIYTPLDPDNDSIRLIKLKPCVKKSDPIVCDLDPASLANNPTFVALSYTWGNPSDLRQIQVNGQHIKIRKNLFEALVTARTDHHEISLWADALCINQADDEEKSRQVALMGHIYKTATLTVIWLGHPPPRVDLANADSTAAAKNIIFFLTALFFVFPDAKVSLRAMNMRTAALLPNIPPVTVVADASTLRRMSTRPTPTKLVEDRVLRVIGSAIQEGLLPRKWDDLLRPQQSFPGMEEALRGTAHGFQLEFLGPGFRWVPGTPYADPRRPNAGIRSHEPVFQAMNQHLLSIVAIEDSFLGFSEPSAATKQISDEASCLLADDDFDGFFTRAFQEAKAGADFHITGALSILHQLTSERHFNQLPFFSPGTPQDVTHYPSRLWSHSLRALIGFFAQEYWRRIWVLQEVARSRTLRILYGKHIVPFSALQDFILALKKHEGPCCQMSITPNWIAELRQLASHTSFMVGCRAHVQFDMPFTLFNVLPPNLIPFNATDPRDHIYAVLGLLDGPNDQDKTCIVPDYTKTECEVFTAAALELVRTTNQLDVFHLKGILGAGNSGILPSWTPDWSGLEGLRNMSLGVLSREFDACRDLEFTYSSSNPGGWAVLELQSVKVDTVGYIFKGRGEQAYSAIEDWHRVALELGISEKLFWRTLVGGCFGTYPDAPPVVNPGGFVSPSSVVPDERLGELVEMGRRFLARRNETLDIEGEPDAVVPGSAQHQFEQRLNSVLPNSQLFITNDMMRLGLASNARCRWLGHGDEIHIVAGCRYPVVLHLCSEESWGLKMAMNRALKPINGGSNVSGERVQYKELACTSYVDGWMFGEAVRDGLGELGPLFLV